MMASYMHHSWTLFSLVTAFFELGVAYFLLCGSVVVFFALKFLLVIRLFVPCPCSGIFGYQNKDMCLQRMLVDWPLRKIYTIQKLAWSSLPFDLVWLSDQEGNSNLLMFRDTKRENDETHLSTRSGSCSRLRSLDDKEEGSSTKVKRVGNQNHKTVISRRNRRAIIGQGKSLLVLPSLTAIHSTSAGVSSSHDTQQQKENDSLQTMNQTANGHSDEIAACGACHGKEYWHRANDPYSKTKEVDGDPLPDKRALVSDELGSENIKNESDVIRILKQALQEEKAARAALYLELENERAAAATAADEAIAMILKLQAEKASLNLEARQYERLTEEKFAYDEEEMNILSEILIKKERENHILEKELAAYKHLDDLEVLSRGDAPEDLALSPMNPTRKSAEQPPTQKLEKSLDPFDITVEKAVYDVHVVEDKIELKDNNRFLEPW